MRHIRHSLPGDPWNIIFLLAFEWDQAPQSVRENLVAPLNIISIVVTFDTSHLEMSALNAAAFQNIPSICFTFDTTHLEMSALNNVAPKNISCIVVTCDTSHLEISALNDFAE